MEDRFTKIEMVILRIALTLFLIIGIVKILKVELSNLW